MGFHIKYFGLAPQPIFEEGIFVKLIVYTDEKTGT